MIILVIMVVGDMVKIVIVVRKDLELSTGKWIAQATHAALRTNTCPDYHNNDVVCIVKYVKSEKKLLDLYDECRYSGMPCGLQVDSGHNEVDPDTPTVLCVGPADADEVDKLTRKLQLLKD